MQAALFASKFFNENKFQIKINVINIKSINLQATNVFAILQICSHFLILLRMLGTGTNIFDPIGLSEVSTSTH